MFISKPSYFLSSRLFFFFFFAALLPLKKNISLKAASSRHFFPQIERRTFGCIHSHYSSVELLLVQYARLAYRERFIRRRSYLFDTRVVIRLFDISSTFEAVSCRVIISACTFSGFVTPLIREKKRGKITTTHSLSH